MLYEFLDIRNISEMFIILKLHCTVDLVKSLTFQIFYYEHALIQIFFALRMIWLLPSFEGEKNFYYIRWVTNGYNLSILIIGFDKAQSVTPFLKIESGYSECKV